MQFAWIPRPPHPGAKPRALSLVVTQHWLRRTRAPSCYFGAAAPDGPPSSRRLTRCLSMASSAAGKTGGGGGWSWGTGAADREQGARWGWLGLSLCMLDLISERGALPCRRMRGTWWWWWWCRSSGSSSLLSPRAAASVLAHLLWASRSRAHVLHAAFTCCQCHPAMLSRALMSLRECACVCECVWWGERRRCVRACACARASGGVVVRVYVRRGRWRKRRRRRRRRRPGLGLGGCSQPEHCGVSVHLWIYGALNVSAWVFPVELLAVWSSCSERAGLCNQSRSDDDIY